ncbi:MAG TPA: pyruvate kinase [Candidatus Omnitrophota bacterium]|nr:pyruvate kinase [Candidatus Omnitrophota bacterium]HRK62123.1 pyruvate kinase [Candidatus Omnitrophota bacterium]
MNLNLNKTLMLKKTKVIATVGPACRDISVLKSLIRAGVDVFRINASHTSPAELKEWVRKIRLVSKTITRPIPILVDLQGPRVRTGRLEGGEPVYLNQGDEVVIVPASYPGSGQTITTSCKPFPAMVKSGDPILFDNGLLELRVVAVRKRETVCRVVTGGKLGENKGINLPNAPVTLPSLSPKDLRDLKAAVEAGVDYLALSFVRNAEDVLTLKRRLRRLHSHIPIIAKIEKPKAVENFAAISRVADGIMVARGDLGIEMGVEKVPVVQKKLIMDSNRMHLPVITATQMLESMIENPRPTRAEASDVANAVFDGTDAVMLSGETAVGKYPVEAIRMMSEIICEAESHIGEIVTQAHEPVENQDLPTHAITHAARHAAKDLGAKAIAVLTITGKTAVFLSKFRPVAPIVAFTANQIVSRRLGLMRGIFPMTMTYGRTSRDILNKAEKEIKKFNFLKSGDPIVVLSGRFAMPEMKYMTWIRFVGERS